MRHVSEHPPKRGTTTPPRAGVRSALTLVELLVVMAILSILVGSAIPILSPASDSRRIREASRGVNTFLAGAQTRAVETGRPFGVRLRKLSRDTGRVADNSVSLELSYIEQPPPFAGFDEGARVMFGSDEISGVVSLNQVLMRFVAVGTAVVQGTDNLPPGFDPDLIVPGLIQPGDIVEVDGRFYEMIDDANGGNDLDSEGFYETDYGVPANSLFVRPIDSTTEAIRFKYDDVGNRLIDPLNQPIRFWTEPQPYKIHRQPTPTSNEPYQLPEGTAIDLRASGLGDAPFYEDDEFDGNQITVDTPANRTTSNSTPIDILFSPEGTIERVFYDVGPLSLIVNEREELPSVATADTLFLLVGLRENAPAPSVESPADADFGDPAQAGLGTDAEIQARKARINWLAPDSRWVVVGARTGTVQTAENAFVDPVVIGDQTTPVDLTNFTNAGILTQRRNLEINAARELAGQRAQVGGR